MPAITATWPQVDQNFVNATVSPDPNNAYMTRLVITTDHTLVNPNFSNVVPLQLIYQPVDGLNQQDARAKTTFAATSNVVNSRAAGQRAVTLSLHESYGMGDASIDYPHISWGGGVDCGGDEGQCWLDATTGQQNTLIRATIVAIATPSTVNTVTTQTITASHIQQEITVASVAGVDVGDWLTVDPQTAASPTEANMECVQVQAVNPTTQTFTALFSRNHSSGVVILPTTILQLSSTYRWGQHRWLVNLSQPAYTTGTASSSTGTGIAGVGTAWSTDMVGGSLTNLGMISFAADDITAAPFGVGDKRLRDWYPISSVNSATGLHILHRSQVGITSYSGLAKTSGAYEIRPGCRIMTFVNNLNNPTVSINNARVVLPFNTFQWTVGDVVECSLSPDIDYDGIVLRYAGYSPGGTHRSFLNLVNLGLQPLLVGINLNSGAYAGNGYAFEAGLAVGHSNIGVKLGKCDTAGLLFVDTSPSSNSHILWHGPGNEGIYYNPATTNLEINLGSQHKLGTVEQGVLTFVQAAPGTSVPPVSGNQGTFYFGGSLCLLEGTDGKDQCFSLRGGGSTPDLYSVKGNIQTHGLDFICTYGGTGAPAVPLRLGTDGANPANPLLGFFNTSPKKKPVVTGKWSDGSAQKSFLAALVTLGLVTDSTLP